MKISCSFEFFQRLFLIGLLKNVLIYYKNPNKKIFGGLKLILIYMRPYMNIKSTFSRILIITSGKWTFERFIVAMVKFMRF